MGAARTYRGTLMRVVLILMLLAALAMGAWAYAARWAPARSQYPMQGISVDGNMGIIDWRTVRARHADFAYIHASSGTASRDAAFAANWAGARDAGLRYGAIHDFSLCGLAAHQATLFMTTVPRDNAALPPVVRLRLDPGCAARPNRDTVLSELNTFLNLIEAHSAKPALVRVSKDFDALYNIGDGINRTLWLEGNFVSPTYASRPWVMWTASDMRHLGGVETPVEWDVVTP